MHGRLMLLFFASTVDHCKTLVSLSAGVFESFVLFLLRAAIFFDTLATWSKKAHDLSSFFFLVMFIFAILNQPSFYVLLFFKNFICVLHVSFTVVALFNVPILKQWV